MANHSFRAADLGDEAMIFEWLAEPHMQLFWDTSNEHKEDILNFIHGKKQSYFEGTAKYFVGFLDDAPFAFIVADAMTIGEPDSPLPREVFSKDGPTVAIDFAIGDSAYLGKGLASDTLEAFLSYYQHHVDRKASIFFIDPDELHTKARHVYEKAGFKIIGNYSPKRGAFVGCVNVAMIK